MKSVQARRRAFKVLFYMGNTAIALIFVSLLLWMIASAFKPEGQIFSQQKRYEKAQQNVETAGK